MNRIYQFLHMHVDRGDRLEVEQACLEILTELKAFKPCYNLKEIPRSHIDSMTTEQRDAYRKDLERDMLFDIACFLRDEEILTIKEVDHHRSDFIALRGHIWIVDSQFDGDPT